MGSFEFCPRMKRNRVVNGVRRPKKNGDCVVPSGLGDLLRFIPRAMPGCLCLPRWGDGNSNGGVGIRYDSGTGSLTAASVRSSPRLRVSHQSSRPISRRKYYPQMDQMNTDGGRRILFSSPGSAQPKNLSG